MGGFRMEFLTSEKHYIYELTIKELLDEYKALGEKASEEATTYLTLPQESSLRDEYYRRVQEYSKQEQLVAKTIADMLTT